MAQVEREQVAARAAAILAELDRMMESVNAGEGTRRPHPEGSRRCTIGSRALLADLHASWVDIAKILEGTGKLAATRGSSTAQVRKRAESIPAMMDQTERLLLRTNQTLEGMQRHWLLRGIVAEPGPPPAPPAVLDAPPPHAAPGRPREERGRAVSTPRWPPHPASHPRGRGRGASRRSGRGEGPASRSVSDLAARPLALALTLLAACSSTPRPTPAVERASVHRASGDEARSMGDPAAAAYAYSRALAAARAADDREMAADSGYRLGAALLAAGQPIEAAVQLEDAAAVALRIGEKALAARALLALGRARQEASAGDLRGALESAFALAERGGEPSLAALAQLGLGATGPEGEAEGQVRAGGEARREGTRVAGPLALNRARLAERRGDLAGAAPLFQVAPRQYRDLEDSPGSTSRSRARGAQPTPRGARSEPRPPPISTVGPRTLRSSPGGGAQAARSCGSRPPPTAAPATQRRRRGARRRPAGWLGGGRGREAADALP